MSTQKNKTITKTLKQLKKCTVCGEEKVDFVFEKIEDDVRVCANCMPGRLFQTYFYDEIYGKSPLSRKEWDVKLKKLKRSKLGKS